MTDTMPGVYQDSLPEEKGQNRRFQGEIYLECMAFYILLWEICNRCVHLLRALRSLTVKKLT